MRPLVIALSVVVVLGAGYVAATKLAEWGAGLASPAEVAPDVEPGLPVTVEVPAGSTATAIGSLLVRNGVVQSVDAFEIAVRTADAAGDLKAGVYALETGMAAEFVVDILVAGPVAETFWVTIPEGLRIVEIIERVGSVSGLSVAALTDALLTNEVTSVWLPDGATTIQDWEGLLFPDTYEFPREIAPAPLLQLLADTMEQRASTVAEEYPYEALIVASLIEAEAAIDEDRPQISSVIANRREMGMPLQIDATVLYAMGVRGVGLTLQDLEIDSPYNTYVIAELPPTPIGAPGLASLRAAVNPIESDYLYYVLTSTDGHHSFTASYDEFLQFKEQAKADGVIP